MTAGLSDEDLIDPSRHTNRGTEGGREVGGGMHRRGREGSMMDGMRTALSKEQQRGNGK